MTVNIRPQDHHAEYQRLSALDRAQLVLQSQGRWVKRACPACGECETRPLFENDGFAYHACTVCATAYLPLIPPADVLSRYYRDAVSSTYFHENILIPSSEVRRDSLFRPRVAWVQERVASGRWLDVGCAIGTSLLAMRDGGFEAVGIELNAAARKHAQSLGFRVDGCDVEDVTDGANTFDVISLFEVVAHLADPLASLRACARLLKPQGVLALTTPHCLGYEYQVLGRHHHNLLFPFLNLFNFHSLTLLLHRAGFALQQHDTPGHSDVATVRDIVSVQSLKVDLSPLEQHILFDGSDSERSDFQAMIRRLNLSGHQRVMAKKRTAS